MLRTVVFIMALTVGLVGVGARLAGHAEATPAALWGVLIAAALLVERWRYRASAAASPDDGWQKTDERFVDPESGQTMRVLYNPRTGERRYEHDTLG
ncbi:hypothetical protein ACG04R_02445 [Roseateles sp. BYS78W]|uniref:Uncharacterized protein n=1 Tax=Pelomonas candidula TaxID=3299025 RepID=A0ABW7H6J5_9BURK